MERAALQALHFSLHIPVSSWADHVNNHFASLITKEAIDELDLITIPALDEMVTEARNVELRDPGSLTPSRDHDRRYSAQELPAAADQALSKDWGSFARTYTINHGDNRASKRQWPNSMDAEMEMAERTVSALVDDDMDEDEEFLDYDGAERWLPSISELRRSASQSSAQGFDSFRGFNQWRSAVQPDPQPRVSYVDSTSRSSWESHPYYPDFSVPHPVYGGATGSTAYKQFVDDCLQCKSNITRSSVSKVHARNAPGASVSPSTYKNTAVFLEPGISIIRPPMHDFSGNPPTAKRWGMRSLV